MKFIATTFVTLSIVGLALGRFGAAAQPHDIRDVLRAHAKGSTVSVEFLSPACAKLADFDVLITMWKNKAPADESFAYAHTNCDFVRPEKTYKLLDADLGRKAVCLLEQGRPNCLWAPYFALKP